MKSSDVAGYLVSPTIETLRTGADVAYAMPKPICPAPITAAFLTGTRAAISFIDLAQERC